MSRVRSAAGVLALVAIVVAAAAGRDAGAASAPEPQLAFPSKLMRVLLGFPPGSSADLVARFIATNLSERLGQQILVDNRPGANGILAAELALKAPPDGHTLLFVSVSHTMNAAVRKLPFDPVSSFAPITMLGYGPLMLVVHPSVPARDVKEFIALARSKPGALNYGVAGMGGINHFAGALFGHMAKVDMTVVPYKGGAQALSEVMGGQVEVMFGTMALSLKQVRAGKVRALGVTADKRSSLIPELPTIAEAGVPGYEISSWWGMVAPAGVPGSIISRLNSEIGAVLKQPSLAQRLEADGAYPTPSTSDAMAQRLKMEVEKWKRVARDSNIKAE
ncbi:MAG: tripartite tricarboxylate transporter substrate binding protein [Burkholderiales bacterium]|nr:tripartite tricarboxylate transporter substrate binding protein [Burkholderiales bacterium]